MFCDPINHLKSPLNEYTKRLLTTDGGTMSQTINALSENLGRIVRNILPGFLILGGASAAHPSWFHQVDFGSTSHLLALAGIAIVAGNTWLVFHRYGLHQLIDILFFVDGKKGPINNRASKKGSTEGSAKQKTISKRRSVAIRPFSSYELYVDVLAKYVVDNLRTVKSDDPVRKHVDLRAANMHLMYIACEVSLLFSFYHESASFFAENAVLMRCVGLIGLFLTILQNWITRRIDWYSVYPPGNETNSDRDSKQRKGEEVVS
jgi:hypothetical protein